jgi:hypothetical protein
MIRWPSSAKHFKFIEVHELVIEMKEGSCKFGEGKTTISIKFSKINSKYFFYLPSLLHHVNELLSIQIQSCTQYEKSSKNKLL